MHTYTFKKGSTNVSIELEIIDSTDGTPETGVVWNTAGIDLQYRRDAAASTAITEATLAALTTAHTDGGFLHIGNGVYRFDLPDAALASGANKVVIHGTVTGMIVIPCVIQLVDYDLFDGTRLGLTALPNAAADAAGGLPISDAGGLNLDGALSGNTPQTGDTYALANGATGFAAIDTVVDGIQTDLSNATDGLGAIKGDTAAILTDTGTTLPATLSTIAGYIDTEVAAILTNLATAQADLDIITGTDGATLSSASQAAAVVAFWSDTLTAYTDGEAGKRLKGITAVPTLEGTVNDASATTTSFITTLTGYGDDFFNDSLMIVEIATDQWQARPVIDYVSATGTFTFDEAFTTAPANSSAIAVRAMHIHPITAIQSGLATEAKQDVIDSIVDAILVDTGTTLPATLSTIAGYIDTEIATIITNLATVDTVVDGIQADLSNGTDGLGALKALIDTLDTVADAVKAKTDSLTFTKAGEVDSNAQSINGVTILGDGSATPFNV